MQEKNKKVVVILGATATGKTKLAVRLASIFNGEIISADSRQVYKGMDIGTGKDLAEYEIRSKKEPRNVPHHLIDIVSPKTAFNVAKYQKMAYRAIASIQKKGKVPFLVGGTGLYIDAVVKGINFAQIENKNLSEIRKRLDKMSLSQLLLKLQKIDKNTYNVIDKKNRRRVQRALEIYYQTGKKKSEQNMIKPDLDFLVLGVDLPLLEIYKKIDKRLETRLTEGMVKEVNMLRDKGVSWKRLDQFGLEYRYASRFLRGQIKYEEMFEQLKNAIHHFAKRQITWFKRNQEIVWITNLNQAKSEINGFLKK